MHAGVSEIYTEEGQRWLRVSPGHAVSEHWLQGNAADLYARWLATTRGEARDRIALQIERRLEDIESPRNGARALERWGHRMPPAELAKRVAAYEDTADQLSTIALTDPNRRAAHLAHQLAGDELRAELTDFTDRGMRDVLERRLDMADLVADRPLIEAVQRLEAQVDRLVATLAGDGHDVEHWQAPCSDRGVGDDLNVAIELDAFDRQLELRLHVDDDYPPGRDVDRELG